MICDRRFVNAIPKRVALHRAYGITGTKRQRPPAVAGDPGIEWVGDRAALPNPVYYVAVGAGLGWSLSPIEEFPPALVVIGQAAGVLSCCVWCINGCPRVLSDAQGRYPVSSEEF